jgi:hypothetical protein
VLTRYFLIGHHAIECTKPRKIDRSHIPDVPAEVAWAELKAASDEKDIDDIKEAAQKYIKATPDATYLQLENAFRAQEMNIYLIATEKELALTSRAIWTRSLPFPGACPPTINARRRRISGPPLPRRTLLAWPMLVSPLIVVFRSAATVTLLVTSRRTARRRSRRTLIVLRLNASTASLLVRPLHSKPKSTS